MFFEAAEKQFYLSHYEEAFAAFNAIAQNHHLSKYIRAEAYNMMGVIIAGCAPYLSKNEDESGLEYFQAALNLDEKNLAAALNILGGYRTSPTGHNNRESVELACHLLEKNNWHDLSAEDRELVVKNRKTLDLYDG